MLEKKFLDKFISILDKGFKNEEIFSLRGNTVGFGIVVKNTYLLKKLHVSENANYVTIIYLYIDREEFEDKTKKLTGVGISLSYYLESRDKTYSDNYKFIKNIKLIPIKVNSEEDYLLDKESLEILNSKKEVINICKVLKNLYSKHINPPKIFRIKLWLHSIEKFIYETLFKLLLTLAKVLFGFSSKHNKILSAHFDKYSPKPELLKRIEYPEFDYINFLGYKIPKYILASYFFIFIIISYLLSKKGIVNLSELQLGNAFTLISILFTIIIYESLLPKLLLVLINKVVSRYGNILYVKFKL